MTGRAFDHKARLPRAFGVKGYLSDEPFSVAGLLALCRKTCLGQVPVFRPDPNGHNRVCWRWLAAGQRDQYVERPLAHVWIGQGRRQIWTDWLFQEHRIGRSDMGHRQGRLS